MNARFFSKKIVKPVNHINKENADLFYYLRTTTLQLAKILFTVIVRNSFYL